MAEHDYVRLAAACACGTAHKVFASSGRVAKKCQKSTSQTRPCLTCGKAMQGVHGNARYCSNACKRTVGGRSDVGALSCKTCGDAFESSRGSTRFCSDACRRGVNPKERPEALTCWSCKRQFSPNISKSGLRLYRAFCNGRCRQRARSLEKAKPAPLADRSCLRCGASYAPKHNVAMYCSKTCKTEAFRLRRPDLIARKAARRSQREAKRSAEIEKLRRKVESEAKKVATDIVSRLRVCPCCAAFFSAIPQNGRVKFCSTDCRDSVASDAKRASRVARKAALRTATVERVSPLRVFERDGWQCYLCGCRTPKELRGSYEPNAPELEHVVPLSRGGAHLYSNVRCACRGCNLIKGDRTLDEVGGAYQAAGGPR